MMVTEFWRGRIRALRVIFAVNRATSYLVIVDSGVCFAAASIVHFDSGTALEQHLSAPWFPICSV